LISHPCTPLIYRCTPSPNYSDLPFAGFSFDELRDEAASQDLRATVVIGVPVFRYTSTFEVVRRRAKLLVLSKGATLQLDDPADSERVVFVGLGSAFCRGPIHHRVFKYQRRFWIQTSSMQNWHVLCYKALAHGFLLAPSLEQTRPA
jgi:hypothetical protein